MMKHPPSRKPGAPENAGERRANLDFAKAKADEYLARAKAALPEGLPDAIREAYEMVADFIGDRDF